MLKGDLATTPLPEVLRSLARSASTGCVRVRVGADDIGQAKVYLRSGKVYAVVLPDRRPQLGPRLVSSGDLDPAALAEAYDAQRTELQGWRLGELLVHLGYVEQDVVEQAVGEQLREAAFELTLWTAGSWRFRPDERTREDVAPPVDVDTLLADLASHAEAWEELRARVHGPGAVPVLSAAGTSPETLSLDGDAWSLLCTVDGTSSLSQLAGSSGLSLLEAAQVVVTLMDAGLVEIEADGVEAEVEAPVEPAAPVLTLVPELEEPADVEEPEPHLPTAEPEAAEPEAAEPEIAEPEPFAGPAAIASRLAEALRGLGPMPVLAPYAPPVVRPAGPGLASTALEGEPLDRSLVPSVDDLSVAGSITRASESLAVTLGETDEEFDPFAVPTTALAAPQLPPLEEHEARRRARDAEELAARHAELEAERAQDRQLARQAMADLANEPAGVATEDAAPRADDEPHDLSAEQVDEVDAPVLSDEVQRATAELQAAAFAELSQAAGAVAPVPAAEPEPVDAQPESQPASEEHDAGSPAPRGADTAALLRELSSLGLEDEPDVVPQQRAATPPVVRPLSSVGARKRKGLFGRG